MSLSSPPTHSKFSAVRSEGVDRLEQTQIDTPAAWAYETLQHIADNVFTQDVYGRILVANRALAQNFGHCSARDLVGKMDFEILPAETAAAFRSMDVRSLETGKPILDEEQDIAHPDGRRSWIKASRIPLYDDARRLIGIVCTFRDVTESRESERLMLAQANLLDMVAQSAPLSEIFRKIVAVVEDHLPEVTGAIQLLSPDRTQLMEPVAPTLAEDVRFCLRDTAGPFVHAALSAIETGGPVIIPDIQAHPDFAPKLAALSGLNIRAFWSVPIFSLERNALGTLSLFAKSVTAPTAVQADLIAMASHMVSSAIERQENAERDKFFASHDSLTRLPNRKMFEESLSDAVEEARRNRSYIALAFFDLDNFKHVNDSLGHGAGDFLLKTVAERAQSRLRPGDLVARLGGDEFVMFLDNLPAKSDFIERWLQEIRQAISAPTDIDGRSVQVTCSMGVAYFPSHADTAASLVANADAAMYRAKQLGRDNIQIFASEMQNVAEEGPVTFSSLHDALVREEFVLHYQPQIDLDTRQLFSAEALVRWNHPDLGLIYPGDFISKAEDTGLIVALGDWVLNAACRQNKKWQEEGHPAIVLSVNVSARQFSGPDLVAQVEAALRSSGLEARYLELELTESLIMQEGAEPKMRELKAMGVRLAIDDFGTGYSSLSALKLFPVDRLKIDRSFIRDIAKDGRDQAITNAIIIIAKTLEMNVIAEGIETSDQLDTIRRLGCHAAQGYYFSKPVSSGKFKMLLGGRDYPSSGPFSRRRAGDDILEQAAL